MMKHVLEAANLWCARRPVWQLDLVCSGLFDPF